MNTEIYIPSSLRDAGRQLRMAFAVPVQTLPKQTFVRAWSSVAYLFSGLHPDGFDEPESGWPAALRPIAAEAHRRADAGEITDEEFYPFDAQWCGIYDRTSNHQPDEVTRRLELASLSVRTADV